MKMMQKSLLALAVLATTSVVAQAANTVDMSVIGTIKPAACTPTLTGGGEVDYGVIVPTSLSPTKMTALASKSVTLTVTCDAPAAIGIKVINKRIGSVAGATEVGAQNAATSPAGLLAYSQGVFGLGLGDSNQKIGGYGMMVQGPSIKADGLQAQAASSDDVGSSWTTLGTSSQRAMLSTGAAARMWTVTANGLSVPLAAKTFTFPVSVQAYINNTTDLNITGEVKLNGLSTFEVVYL